MSPSEMSATRCSECSSMVACRIRRLVSAVASARAVMVYVLVVFISVTIDVNSGFGVNGHSHECLDVPAPLREVGALGLIGTARDRLVVRGARLGPPAGALQQGCAARGQPMTVGERLVEPVQQRQARLGSVRLGDGDRAVQSYD